MHPITRLIGHDRDAPIFMPDTPQFPAQIVLPEHIAGSGRLDRLVDTARGYAGHPVAKNRRGSSCSG